MPHDDNDLGSILLGSSDSSSDGDFDPFEPVVRENDATDGGHSFGHGTDAEPDYGNGILRYGGTSSEGSEGIPADGSGPLLGAGATRELVEGAEQQRGIDQRRTRDNNLRRTTEQRSGGSETGAGRRTAPTGMADSIRSAAERIRTNIRTNIAREPDDEERMGIGRQLADQDEKHNRNIQPKVKKVYEKQAVLTPPQFRHTEFEAIVSKLTSNVDGSWMLTLRIPPPDRENATILGDAYGLALDVTINRKSYTRGPE